jgi:hypothetical protein
MWVFSLKSTLLKEIPKVKQNSRQKSRASEIFQWLLQATADMKL